jgi:hypothetical protein
VFDCATTPREVFSSRYIELSLLIITNVEKVGIEIVVPSDTVDPAEV